MLGDRILEVFKLGMRSEDKLENIRLDRLERRQTISIIYVGEEVECGGSTSTVNREIHVFQTNTKDKCAHKSSSNHFPECVNMDRNLM